MPIKIDLTLDGTKAQVVDGAQFPNSQKSNTGCLGPGAIRECPERELKDVWCLRELAIEPPDHTLLNRGLSEMPATATIINLFDKSEIPATGPPVRAWSEDECHPEHGNRRRFSIDEIGPPVDGMVSFEATVPAEILQSVLLLLSVPGSHLEAVNGKIIVVNRNGVKVIDLGQQETEFT